MRQSSTCASAASVVVVCDSLLNSRARSVPLPSVVRRSNASAGAEFVKVETPCEATDCEPYTAADSDVSGESAW